MEPAGTRPKSARARVGHGLCLAKQLSGRLDVGLDPLLELGPPALDRGDLLLRARRGAGGLDRRHELAVALALTPLSSACLGLLEEREDLTPSVLEGHIAWRLGLRQSWAPVQSVGGRGDPGRPGCEPSCEREAGGPGQAPANPPEQIEAPSAGSRRRRGCVPGGSAPDPALARAAEGRAAAVLEEALGMVDREALGAVGRLARQESVVAVGAAQADPGRGALEALARLAELGQRSAGVADLRRAGGTLGEVGCEGRALRTRQRGLGVAIGVAIGVATSVPRVGLARVGVALVVSVSGQEIEPTQDLLAAARLRAARREGVEVEELASQSAVGQGLSPTSRCEEFVQRRVHEPSFSRRARRRANRARRLLGSNPHRSASSAYERPSTTRQASSSRSSRDKSLRI